MTSQGAALNRSELSRRMFACVHQEQIHQCCLNIWPTVFDAGLTLKQQWVKARVCWVAMRSVK